MVSEVVLIAYLGLMNNPIGVFLIEFAFGVDHLRLYPDTETDALFGSSLREASNSTREFVVRFLPVTKALTVRRAGILVAEPAIVEQEKVNAHVGGVFHELDEALLVETEIGSLPVVE